ncbi:MAG: transglycosylase domain-containing protein, partial [Nannocystaceae bacterium]
MVEPSSPTPKRGPKKGGTQAETPSPKPGPETGVSQAETPPPNGPGLTVKAAKKPFNWRLVRKVFLVLGILGFLGILAGVSTVVGVFWYYGRGIEGIDVAAIRDYRPKQVTRIVARDGTILGELYTERRTLIGFEDLPTHVVHAFLAAEDADFYNHKGMDYVGMVRAMISNIEAGAIRQGASTITQQLAKNLWLEPSRNPLRKVREAILTVQLERQLEKRRILELYLNVV